MKAVRVLRRANELDPTDLIHWTTDYALRYVYGHANWTVYTLFWILFVFFDTTIFCILHRPHLIGLPSLCPLDIAIAVRLHGFHFHCKFWFLGIILSLYLHFGVLFIIGSQHISWTVYAAAV